MNIAIFNGQFLKRAFVNLSNKLFLLDVYGEK